MNTKTAPISRRFVSLCYEILLLLGIVFGFFLFPQTMLGILFNYVAPNQILIIHLFLVVMIYFVWFWLKTGQTLAMKTWRIRLVSADGYPLRPMQACLRCMAAWISLLLCGLGFLWAFIDRDQLFFHDRIAGTIIIMVP